MHWGSGMRNEKGTSERHLAMHGGRVVENLRAGAEYEYK